VWERSRGGGGEAVAALKEWGFPSLTALRRSDLLALLKFTDELWFV
jgi:hypothetical protein